METFVTKQASTSKLFLKVDVDFKDLARTWVIKEESNATNPQKVLVKDSKPGDGNINFFEIGETITYKDINKVVIVTYLDLQKITDTEAFMKNLVISYYLVEDDDVPGNFIESKIYKCKKSEMVVSAQKKILLITKIIEIK